MQLTIRTTEHLVEAARTFLNEVDINRVIAFYGQMGAGKTTFIRALCAELGVEDVVTSPTFALVNEYLGADGRSIYHFDFYRIHRLSEAWDMGCEEYFASGHPCFIEWPEMVEELLPPDTLRVHINVLPDGVRTLTT